MKTGIIALLIFGWSSYPALAFQAELQDLQQEITSIRIELQKNTASFLLVTKQLTEKYEPRDTTVIEQTARIMIPEAIIRESDLETADSVTVAIEGDEFPVEEVRDDWVRVKRRNGRKGWIHRDQVQLIEREVVVDITPPRDPRILELTNELYGTIQNLRDEADDLFAEFDEAYNALSESEKQQVSTLYNTYLDEKEKIRTYTAYANHYQEKLPTVERSPVATTIRGQDIRYQGTATLRLGTSSYEAGTEQSTTSRNLGLNGSVIFSPQSRLNINISHNSDVVQTPYTSNDVKLAYQHLTDAGTRLGGSLLYNSYNDDLLDRNNFNNVGLGLNVNHPLSPTTRVYGDVQANSKSFEVVGGNEFKGAAFNSGLNYRSSNMMGNIGVRGRLQSSDVSFLNYTRVIPNARLRYVTGRGTLGVRAEAEHLGYATEAEGNNFNRGRVDLEWSRNITSTALIFIAKQFPNNETFDNYTLRVENEWKRSEGIDFSRTSLSLQYIYHPQEENVLSNYVDLRVDRNSSSEKFYFDLNLFGRYWEEASRDHRVDLFSRVGFKYEQFQIGPAFGAQLLLNQDDLKINRNGNSFRLGIDGRVNTIIQKAAIHAMIRIQKSLVYNNEIAVDPTTGTVTQGDIKTRLPTTVQLNAGLQVPIIDLLDLKVDLRYYNVNLDIDETISINPVQSRTGFRLLAGVSYRFQS